MRARATRQSATTPVFDAADVVHKNIQLDILAVDQALGRLAALYPRCARVVELRFFGGMEFPEISQVMDISLATVERDWRFARAWLRER
jgi:DNA-directed RNA polymerase specialized sigma24 family protein